MPTIILKVARVCYIANHRNNRFAMNEIKLFYTVLYRTVMDIEPYWQFTISHKILLGFSKFNFYVLLLFNTKDYLSYKK